MKNKLREEILDVLTHAKNKKVALTASSELFGS